jgi:hypothetical protein
MAPADTPEHIIQKVNADLRSSLCASYEKKVAALGELREAILRSALVGQLGSGQALAA